MIGYQNPIEPAWDRLPEVAALDPSERELVHLILDEPLSLTQLADRLGTDIVTLTLRLSQRAINAAFDAISCTAVMVAQLRAVASSGVALHALSAASSTENPDLTERRRAATVLLRAAPTSRTSREPAIPSDVDATDRGVGAPAEVESTGSKPVDSSVSQPPADPTPPAQALAFPPTQPTPAASIISRAGQPHSRAHARDRPDFADSLELPRPAA